MTGASPGHPSRPGVGLPRSAGVISIVSALTPEFADRTDLVNGVLPPGVPEAARTVALALGLAMIFLSRGLARRKQPGVDARGRAGDRVGDRASREGSRLRGGDCPHRPARCAPAFAPPLRCAGRSGDAGAAPAGRRRARGRRADPPRRALRPRRVLASHRGGARAAHRRARLSRALALAATAGSAARTRGGARACGRARAGARHRQPRVLRAAPRQELLLLTERPIVPRVPRDRRHGARRRRLDRRRHRAA